MSSRCSCSERCWLAFLAAAVLFILLLIGGIEPNPGPSEYQCRVCHTTFKSPASYCEHFRLHPRYKASGAIPCSVLSCAAKISSVASFKSHLSLYHKKAPPLEVPQPVSTLVCICPVEGCSKEITTKDTFVSHMNTHLKNNVQFKCPLKNCPGTLISKCPQLSVHVTRYHGGKENFERNFQQTRTVMPSTSETSCGDPSLLHEECGSSSDSLMDDFPAPIADDSDDEDLYPISAIKDELARFYLRLEGFELLPSSTVQLIADEIKLISELIHHVLKKNLKEELGSLKLDPSSVKHVISQTFLSEPVFNVHHRGRDVQQLGTEHMRYEYWKENFRFVLPKEIPLGVTKGGRKRCAQHVSIRKSLELLLRDPKAKEDILKSFNHLRDVPDLSNCDCILQDFTDGKIFCDHMKCEEHDGKNCIQLLIFQDAFDPNAFSSTTYKPLGFYYSVGNLPAHLRSRLEKIQMAFIALEQDLKNSLKEELGDIDRLSDALDPLIKDLIDLKENGVVIDGETVPVCLLFLIGDSLGQNFIGRFTTNFSNSQFSCRFCIMSKDDFLANPEETRQMRTTDNYDNNVVSAKALWMQRRRQALKVAKAKAEKAAARCTAPANKTRMRDAVSRHGLQTMTCVNMRGVKYRPSPFNRKELNFHVVNHQPPCLAHDLFEGVVKRIVAHILKHFIVSKNWFTLDTLNSRIKSFKPKGSDAGDKPKPLKKLDQLGGNAVENWNLLRLGPFIFGDLIEDREDPHWKMFLLLKRIVEYVCAPRISVGQIAFLKTLIADFISLVKEFLPSCLVPKLHYLCHYPTLILMFGPLIRLFTLRFESKHVFFKRVIRSCKNYNNLTCTMAKKYVCRMAYDNSFGTYEDIVCDDVSAINFHSETGEVKKLLSTQVQQMCSVTYLGTKYTEGSYLILASMEGLQMKLGCIKKIVKSQSGVISLLLEEVRAKNSLQGYHCIESRLDSHSLWAVQDLPDYYPLESYFFKGKECVALKHSVPFIY